MMDEGTDARDILENNFLPLKKGYVGVVNRSQKDINSRKDIKQALAAEREFFLSSHPYRGMADKMGTKYLQQVLNQELSSHIKEKLPKIQVEIKKKFREAEEKLKDLDYNDEEMDGFSLIHEALRGFSDLLYNNLEGIGDSKEFSDVVSGGVLIKRAFYHEFPTYFNAISSVDTLQREIGVIISLLTGKRTGLFIPNQAFENIVQILLETYKTPMVMCVTHIRKLMDDTIEKCLATLAKYPQMKKEVLRLMTEELDKNEKETNQELDNFIENLKAFMDVGHPDFTGKPDFSAGSCTTSKLGLPYSMNV